MVSKAALRDKLTAFDGRALTVLGKIEVTHREDTDFHLGLAALASDAAANVASGATWLLKSALDAGGAIGPEATTALAQNLPGEEAWQAQLHVCQSIGRLKLAPAQIETLARWLQPLLTHERPFLRAWSLNALWSLSEQDAALKPGAEAALLKAKSDPAASVRARARNLR